MNKMDKESDYERYLAERKPYVDIQLNQVEQFDKNMLMLSSGAFGISFAFISQIVRNPVANTGWILIIAWSAMALTILNTMISFLVSYKANDREVLIIDIEYRNRVSPHEEEQAVPVNRLRNVPAVMNYISIALFAIGMLFMLLYVAKNLNNGRLECQINRN